MDVMRPNVLDHYKVMESDGLEQLRTISEEMDSEDTVIMISTRAPYNRWVITFKFHAAKITTMDQVHEMSIAVMISEGCDIAFELDAIYRENSLPGSQHGLGSSAILHHKCRHMAAQLESNFKKSAQMGISWIEREQPRWTKWTRTPSSSSRAPLRTPPANAPGTSPRMLGSQMLRVNQLDR